MDSFRRGVTARWRTIGSGLFETSGTSRECSRAWRVAGALWLFLTLDSPVLQFWCDSSAPTQCSDVHNICSPFLPQAVYVKYSIIDMITKAAVLSLISIEVIITFHNCCVNLYSQHPSNHIPSSLLLHPGEYLPRSVLKYKPWNIR